MHVAEGHQQIIEHARSPSPRCHKRLIFGVCRHDWLSFNGAASHRRSVGDVDWRMSPTFLLSHNGLGMRVKSLSAKSKMRNFEYLRHSVHVQHR